MFPAIIIMHNEPCVCGVVLVYLVLCYLIPNAILLSPAIFLLNHVLLHACIYTACSLPLNFPYLPSTTKNAVFQMSLTNRVLLQHDQSKSNPGRVPVGKTCHSCHQDSCFELRRTNTEFRKSSPDSSPCLISMASTHSRMWLKWYVLNSVLIPSLYSLCRMLVFPVSSCEIVEKTSCSTSRQAF